MKREFAENLLDYIYESPTDFNAVNTSKDLLIKNGFSDNTFISVLPIKLITAIFLPLQLYIP